MPEFPAVIDLSTLDGGNGFQINGAAAGDRSGISVASAGDVNGDGFGDLLIGADYADPKGSKSGASCVVFGKDSGFAAAIELSSLDGSDGFRIDGEAADDFSGRTVSGAGDVNGDGFADLLIGADYADPGGFNSGASYVVFGKAFGFAATLDLSALDGTDGFKIDGAAASDYSGCSVSTAGDVNGDGLADILIGAYRADPNGNESGASYVVFGTAGGFAAVLDLATLDGSDGFRISGESAVENSGIAVSAAGDVNGDGFADVLIGADGVDDGGTLSGASYIVFGKAGPFAANLNLTALDGINGFQINGESAGDFSGRSLSGAGDINGDGFADIVIGAHGADPNGSFSGASYVVFGRANGFVPTLNLSSLDGTIGFQINGEGTADNSGRSVSAAGDVNGDGFDDLLIGAPSADPNGLSSGASYVVFGKAGGFAANLSLSGLDGNNGFRVGGEAAGDGSGRAVSAAGDVNGDGIDDLLIGAPYADPNGLSAGASYVVFGHRALTSVAITGTALGLTHNGGLGDDTVDALDGNDTVRGWEGDDTLRGGSGNDTIDGGAGNDAIFGGSGNDTIDGGGGADTIDTGSGSEFVTGGDGGDTISCGDGGSTVFGGTGDDTIVAAGGANDLEGGSGNDRITAGDGNDLILGEAGADTIDAGAGVDLVYGGQGGDIIAAGDGDDNVNGDTGDDTISGGDGTDTLAGGDDDDALSGGLGDDTILGEAGADTISGGNGSDTIDGGSGGDSLDGGSDNDAIAGGTGDDTVLGGDGDDSLAGGDHDDILTGGAGLDTLDGGTGSDAISAGSGNDNIQASRGDDTVDGGGETDTLSFATLNSVGIVCDLAAGIIDFTNIEGSIAVRNVERVAAASVADTIAGNSRNNLFSGGNGKDTLDGAGGNDVLIGGANKDTMTGGSGADDFDYNALADSGLVLNTRDEIVDFLAGFDDLDLSTLDAQAGTGGNQAFSYIGQTAFTAEGQVRAIQSGANTIVEINTTGTSGAEMTIQLNAFTATTLTAGDFIL